VAARDVAGSDVVVVVLGFGGSSLGDLTPVLDHYAAKYPEWRSVAAVRPAFPPGPMAAAAEGQEDAILAACAGARHILVHSFSNNGASTLGSLIAKSPGFKSRLRGCVFDSAADMHGDRDMMVDALSGMCKALFLSDAADVARAKVVDGPEFAGCVAAIVDANDGEVLREQTAGLEHLCSNLPPYCRYLFIHSEGDMLIRKASIEAFIDLLRCFASQTTPIQSHCFDHSPHCRHFDYYRDDYTARLAAFLAVAIEKAPCATPLSG
jgi:hypothetical protein